MRFYARSEFNPTGIAEQTRKCQAATDADGSGPQCSNKKKKTGFCGLHESKMMRGGIVHIPKNE